MAFSGNVMCTSFKKELFTATHDFTASSGDAFKLALYDNNASFTAATTDYTATNEVPNGSGYTTGGATLTSVTPVISGTTAYCDFADVAWSTASFSAYGGLIWNSSAGTNSVVVLDFGSVKTATDGVFSVRFPEANSSAAIIRIA